MKNLFIAFEGIDGTGKTTHATLLKHKLEAIGYEVFCYRTIPSRGGWLLDNIALESKLNSARVKFGNYSVAVVEAIDRVLNENLYLSKLLECQNKKIIIIAERYNYGYLAKEQQRLSREEFELVKTIYDMAIKPDYVFYLELDEKKVIERINKRNYGFESETYLKNYKNAYERLGNFNLFNKIDVSGTMEETQKKIFDVINRLII